MCESQLRGEKKLFAICSTPNTFSTANFCEQTWLSAIFIFPERTDRVKNTATINQYSPIYPINLFTQHCCTIETSFSTSQVSWKEKSVPKTIFQLFHRQMTGWSTPLQSRVRVLRRRMEQLFTKYFLHIFSLSRGCCSRLLNVKPTKECEFFKICNKNLKTTISRAKNIKVGGGGTKAWTQLQLMGSTQSRLTVGSLLYPASLLIGCWNWCWDDQYKDPMFNSEIT